MLYTDLGDDIADRGNFNLDCHDGEYKEDQNFFPGLVVFDGSPTHYILQQGKKVHFPLRSMSRRPKRKFLVAAVMCGY